MQGKVAVGLSLSLSLARARLSTIFLGCELAASSNTAALRLGAVSDVGGRLPVSILQATHRRDVEHVFEFLSTTAATIYRGDFQGC